MGRSLYARDSLDELYVVSDLHVGGGDGFRILGQVAELASLIEWLAERPSGRRVGLVVNGDFVDFLAEEPARYFDPRGAARKLERVVHDPEFQPLWKALATFVSRAGRALFLNLGNHDLELSLPWMRERLLEVLAGADAGARGRITLAFDGAGIRLDVGGRQVLCVHGNEVDDWNLVDHEKLRRIGRELTQSRAVDEWIPNGGTQLVIEVMNEIKERYPFVDVLKPEAEAVVPTLLWLEPALGGKVDLVTSAFLRRTRDGLARSFGFLGGEGNAAEHEPGSGALPTSVTVRAEHRKLADEYLGRVESQFREGLLPMDLVPLAGSGQQLGLMSAVGRRILGRSEAEVLQAALEKLDRDRSFEPSTSDETFRLLDRRIGAGIDFVVAGHTHMERALRRENGSGFYFNSGTWAWLAAIKPEQRRDVTEVERIMAAFRAGTLEALRAAGLLVGRPTVVSIVAAGSGRVEGRLNHFVPSPSPSLKPVAGLDFDKG